MAPRALPGLPPRTRAAQTIRSWIGQRRLQPGERIPAELSLAESLGIARGTVRQALALLAAEGLIVKQPNRGHVVAPRPAASSAPLARTVVRIGDAPPAGDDDAVGLAVSGILRDAACDQLSLHPARLDETHAAALAAHRPLGAIALHEVWRHAPALAWLRRMAHAGIAVAVHGDGDEIADLDRATADHETGGWAAAQALIARGRRRLRLVKTFPFAISWFTARAAGVARACREAGLPVLPPLLVDVPVRSGHADARHFQRRARTYAGYLLDALRCADRTDGFLMVTDGDAPGLIAGARLHGARPGEDFDVAGFDGSWSGLWERAHEPTPPLVTVDPDHAAIGRALATLVLERAEGRHAGAARRVVVPPRVVHLAG